MTSPPSTTTQSPSYRYITLADSTADAADAAGVGLTDTEEMWISAPVL